MNRLTLSTKILGCVVIVANGIGVSGFGPLTSQICHCVSLCGTGVMLYLGAQPIPPAVLLKASTNPTPK